MNFNVIKADKNTNFDAIKKLYYQTWQYSYQGLVPEKLLNSLDENDTWHPEKRMNNTLIAVTTTGEIIGVCSYGPARKEAYAGYGEIYSLYVLPKWQHQGIGQKLFQAALDTLTTRFPKLYLLVLQNNLFAQAFYEWFGFKETNQLITDQTKLGTLYEAVFVK